MKKAWKKVVACLARLMALGLFLLIAHWRAKAGAEKYKAQLRAQGEKLSIAELIPVPPASGSNGVQVVINAAARLSGLDSKVQPTVMKMVQPGRARVTWMQPVLPTDQSSNIWPELQSELEAHKSTFAELREGLAKPLLHFPLNYQQGFSILLPHLAMLRGSSRWLSTATILKMHQQDSAEAWGNLRSLVALPVSWREEPFMISQLVRCAIVSDAGSATWEALHYPHWRDDQLVELQSLWASLDILSQLAPSLAMERACGLVEYPTLRASLSKFDNVMGGGSTSAADDLADLTNKALENPKEGFDELVDRFPRRWAWKWWASYPDEAWFLEWHQMQLQIARQIPTNHAFVPFIGEWDEAIGRLGEPPRQFLFSREVGSTMYRSCVKRAFTAEAQRRILVTAIALRRFERQHGQRPLDLSVLVPQFLPAVPLDPMDGQPLRYRLVNDKEFQLYSVGEDGVDDGGDPRPADVTSKNFYWMRCRDWVWPMLASAEEIRQYHLVLEQERAKQKK